MIYIYILTIKKKKPKHRHKLTDYLKHVVYIEVFFRSISLIP